MGRKQRRFEVVKGTISANGTITLIRFSDWNGTMDELGWLRAGLIDSDPVP